MPHKPSIAGRLIRLARGVRRGKVHFGSLCWRADPPNPKDEFAWNLAAPVFVPSSVCDMDPRLQQPKAEEPVGEGEGHTLQAHDGYGDIDHQHSDVDKERRNYIKQLYGDFQEAERTANEKTECNAKEETMHSGNRASAIVTSQAKCSDLHDNPLVEEPKAEEPVGEGEGHTLQAHDGYGDIGHQHRDVDKERHKYTKQLYGDFQEAERIANEKMECKAKEETMHIGNRASSFVKSRVSDNAVKEEQLRQMTNPIGPVNRPSPGESDGKVTSTDLTALENKISACISAPLPEEVNNFWGTLPAKDKIIQVYHQDIGEFEFIELFNYIVWGVRRILRKDPGRGMGNQASLHDLTRTLWLEYCNRWEDRNLGRQSLEDYHGTWGKLVRELIRVIAGQL